MKDFRIAKDFCELHISIVIIVMIQIRNTQLLETEYFFQLNISFPLISQVKFRL